MDYGKDKLEGLFRVSASSVAKGGQLRRIAKILGVLLESLLCFPTLFAAYPEGHGNGPRFFSSEEAKMILAHPYRTNSTISVFFSTTSTISSMDP